MTTDFKQGSVVYSVKGRDKGVFYVCVSPVTDNYVFVSDGATHKLNKPKRKNIKHIKSAGASLDGIAAKLIENKKVFDSELKSGLRCFSQSHR